MWQWGAKEKGCSLFVLYFLRFLLKKLAMYGMFMQDPIEHLQTCDKEIKKRDACLKQNFRAV